MDAKAALIERTRRFSNEVGQLAFPASLYVYNPLDYAWQAHRQYLERYVRIGADSLFLGMNPGPFGMAQTGIPFGEVDAVRRWMGIEAPVGKPEHEHPKRPVDGFATCRHEVSGKRLWGLMEDRFGTAEAFFHDHAVMNYCPLVFVDGGPTGKNVVPEKLPRATRAALEELCDAYLADVLNLIGPRHLIGVGSYAAAKLREVAGAEPKHPVVTLLHPSPGNPKANAGWAAQAERQLQEAGLWRALP